MSALRRLVLLAPFAACPLAATVCAVPSASYPTIAAAISAPPCDTIQIGPGTFAENLAVGRDLTLAGAGAGLTRVAGALVASGATTDLTLAELTLDGTATGVAGCWRNLLATTDGARVSAEVDVVVTNSGLMQGACRLFADGFESGGTLAWSARQP